MKLETQSNRVFVCFQPILESFNKEQEAFIKGQGGGNGPAVAPWVGHANEAKIKDEILGLSQDRRNFVRAPPAGVDFEFNYDTAYPTALAIMNEDKALETMRFELVPKMYEEFGKHPPAFHYASFSSTTSSLYACFVV